MPIMPPAQPKTTPSSHEVDRVLGKAFARLDALAMGVALGGLVSLGILGATLVLVIRGGEPIGPTLGLIGQYFPGYTVTATGGVVGGLYGFVLGFVLGWVGAAIRNLCVAAYLFRIRLNAQLSTVHDVIDD